MRPLYDLQPAQPRNARLWDGTAGTGAITVPSEIRNAATLDDARRLAGMNPHLPHREDVRAAFVAGREQREAPVVAPKETTMARFYQRATKEQIAERREWLRAYLEEHGATERSVLVESKHYTVPGRSLNAARVLLNADLLAIGVESGRGRGSGPVSLPDAAPEPEVTLTRRREPVTRAPDTAPVRPSLARAAREAIREANESDAPVYLEPAFAKALHGMLVEAGL